MDNYVDRGSVPGGQPETGAVDGKRPIATKMLMFDANTTFLLMPDR
jgi:hypothetical protein